MGPIGSELVQSGPNRSDKDKQINKDKNKDQVGHGFDFCLFLDFYYVPKSAKRCQKVPKSAKKCQKGPKKCQKKGKRVAKKFKTLKKCQKVQTSAKKC